MENEIQTRAVPFTKTNGVYTLSGIVEVPATANNQKVEVTAQIKFNQMIAKIESGEQIGEM